MHLRSWNPPASGVRHGAGLSRQRDLVRYGKKEKTSERALEPAFATVKDGCDFLAVSQAEMYRLLGLGVVEGVKAGKRTLLKVESLKARAASLPPAKIKPPPKRERQPHTTT
jgi:hypothetical protein